MAETSTIEWTDASWTPIRARYFEIQSDGSGKERIGWHCEHASEACRFCYAESINRRLGTGLDFKPGNLYREEKRGYKNGEAKLFLDEKMLTAPLRWKRPRMIFVCSMTDLFADFVADEWIDRVFATMALAPRHLFQVLTKRPERMRAYLTRLDEEPHQDTVRRIANAIPWASNPTLPEEMVFPLPNVWLGTSCEDQATADARIPHLLATPAAIRFVSYEPALGPVDFRRWMFDWGCESCGYGGDQTEDHCPNCGWKGDAESEFAPCPDCGEELSDYYACPECHATNEEGFGVTMSGRTLGYLDQIIAGGESGPHARPAHPDWFRQTRDQCAAAGVAFFFKQWGRFSPQHDEPLPEAYWASAGAFEDHHVHKGFCFGNLNGQRPWMMFDLGKKQAGALLDGRAHRAFPGVTA